MIERRNMLTVSAGTAIAAMAAAAVPLASAAERVAPAHRTPGGASADSVTAKDGTRIFFKDWGTGKPVVLSHGWPLDADAWDAQMLFLVRNGCRVIAHDRRGHGRSGQSSGGNDVDTYADDLAAVMNALDIKDAMLVGHSMGGGEVVRYIGRHGASRVSKLVLISAVVPLMLKTEGNPEGLPGSAFDDIRKNLTGNRSAFYKTLAGPFYGFNKPDAKTDPATVDEFWREAMAGSILAQYQCVQQFEVDYTADMKKIDIPVLVLHGDADQLVPIDVAGKMSAKILRHATLKVYPGAPHGMCTTHADKVNADLLEFLRG
ncbi:alpha/beta hydrolase [Caballeronia sp. LZ035]|uniref:alpha/beta fold hydrolase n=1 Tax=Caballeronia sp. LZ035 TaxID=3038568 RepID=UPI00285B4E31|nr:alpha/beta hydrolase [Caballeronia sp. LZ035]MDR5758595.1 alpha/beta hydrolase [Caballeronia sp. LZ035]